MPEKIALLDSGQGILNILESGTKSHLPDARPLAATATRDTGLNDLFPHNAAEKHLDALLSPPTGDGTVLQPEVFRAELQTCLQVMQNDRKPAVRAFVRDELAPRFDVCAART